MNKVIMHKELSSGLAKYYHRSFEQKW